MSISKMLAMGFGLAVTMGPAVAAAEWASFTDRVQTYQGIGIGNPNNGGVEQGYATSDEYAASEPAAPYETGSFTDRALAHQLPAALSARQSTEEAAPELTFEATSFINRVEITQGIGPVGVEQGAAAGEPSTP